MALTKKPKDKLVTTHDRRHTPPMNSVCKLGEMMGKRNVNAKQLSKMTGVSPDTISKLTRDTWSSVDREILGRIAAALNVGVHDLFVTLPADIWFPIRRHKSVTVHFGSTSTGALKGRKRTRKSGGEDAIDRQFIGVWDHRAFAHVYNYLAKTSLGTIFYEFEEHDISEVRVPSDGYLKSRNHIVIASPIVNPFAEYAVCFAAEVPACTAGRAAAFPFNFRWQETPTVSSFGAPSGAGQLGIIETQSQRVVAERTVVPEGEGSDCGLIMTYRFSPPETERRLGGENDDYIIIVIMGHSGCGTLASAQLLCDEETAAGLLYPEERDLPAFGVCAATYTRARSSLQLDNRIVRSAELVSRFPKKK